jgi:hypothetical protein
VFFTIVGTKISAARFRTVRFVSKSSVLQIQLDESIMRSNFATTVNFRALFEHVESCLIKNLLQTFQQQLRLCIVDIATGKKHR